MCAFQKGNEFANLVERVGLAGRENGFFKRSCLDHVSVISMASFGIVLLFYTCRLQTLFGDGNRFSIFKIV